MDQRAPSEEQLPGRSDALAAIDAALASVARGRRGILLVEGEAGVGKTTLLRTALTRRPAVVVWATGDEDETDLDHGVVEQLARAAPLDPASRTELLGAIGGDPLAVGAALVGLVDGLSLDPARPLVVVVDDAQWADDASLRALTFGARRLRRDPVLLCIVTRPRPAALPAGLRRLAEDEGTVLILPPLDRSGVRAVAERALGQPVSAAVAERLLEHTRGNPLHLRTLLEELPPDVIMRPGDLPSPRSYSNLVLARLAGAGAEVQALVVAVSVLGDPAPMPTAVRLAAVEDPAAALDMAIELGLLETTTGPDGGLQLAIGHPLARAAVLHDLPAGRRAALQRRAGELVGGTAGLRHRLQGALGPDGQLFADAVAVAGLEAHRGAHSSAASLLRAAVSVAPDDGGRALALLEALDQLLLAGRLADVDSLRAQADALPPSARRSYLQGRLGYVLGPRRAARDHLAAAWDALVGDRGEDDLTGALDEDDRSLAGRVAAMLATAAVDRADGASALAWARRALALAPDQAALSSAGHMLAAGWALTGRFEEGLRELDARCAALGRMQGAAGVDGPAFADAHSARGLLRLWSHDLDGAAADLEASLAAASRAGSFVARESTRAYLAEVRYRQGRWDEAIVLAEVASSIVDDTDQVWMAALPHATASQPRAGRGDPARGHLDAAAAAAEAAGGGVARGLTWVAALEVAACERDLEAALAAGAALSATPRPVDDRIAPWRATYVEALIRAERGEEAAAVARDLTAAAAGPAGTALLRADAARATLALADGRDAGSTTVDDVAEAALADPADAVGPYPRARLELVAGRLWRRRGERRRAATVLRAAAERFAALGARPWLEQTEREIAALGLRPVRSELRRGSGLTPQEQAVAHLVASGLTNREVGAELVVSAKTVEHHLSRIYAKLGVRSRTELARLLPADP